MWHVTGHPYARGMNHRDYDLTTCAQCKERVPVDMSFEVTSEEKDHFGQTIWEHLCSADCLEEFLAQRNTPD